jgi:hypothetical protein
MKRMLKKTSQVVLAILTIIIVAIPAQADVTGNEFFLPHCVKIANLEKYSNYQIIAKVSLLVRTGQQASAQDTDMQPGSCVSLSYKQTMDFYAIDKSGAGATKPKLIPGNLHIPYYYRYTDDNSELPWYISDVQDELQIVEITPNALSLKQKTIYHHNYLFWALSFFGALILMIILISRRIWKRSKSVDL